jgi:hypothetical protein
MDRRVWLVVLLAFGVRLAMLVFVGDATGFREAMHTTRGVAWDWGYEQGAIAQALAAGRGFADPFLRGSGPTGWATPLFPLLVAGLLKVFGGVVYPTAVALAVLQALAAALVPWWLWRLGRATHSVAVGWLAALLFALHPIAVYLPVTLVWDSTFVALGVTWFLARVAEEGPRAPAMVVMRLGAMLGLVALVNPAPLAFVPAALWYWLRPRDGAARARAGAAFLAGLTLVAGPWALRNLVVLGSPNLRTNLGVELFVGNNDDARGSFNGRIHPAYDAAEYTRYLALGEVAYAADAGARARAWMRANPGRFARLTVERVQRFWVGPDPFAAQVLGSGERSQRDWQGWIEWLCHAFIGVCGLVGAATFRARDGAATLVRGALLLFPLVYYVTHVFERYRFPIEPVLVLAASVLLVRVLPARWRGTANEPLVTPQVV